MQTTLQNQLRPAVLIVLMMTVVLGVLYPLLVTGIGQVLFPHQANGSLLVDETGAVIGSALIGQPFSTPEYFWGRLSATADYPYNAGASSGSNYGPLNADLLAAVQARAEALRAADPDNTAPIPVDLVTASSSGLDPHISPAAALYQVPRVAEARRLDEATVLNLIDANTEGRWLGVLGEPVVNVLTLNLALDALADTAED
ncbi:MAG: potassium-transporting ATPase subunit KdpC [Chloroflexaceae bacterium]|nr:potassium-transporting ATPase subunit KdpC [Chloroflexaceae bacterium]